MLMVLNIFIYNLSVSTWILIFIFAFSTSFISKLDHFAFWFLKLHEISISFIYFLACHSSGSTQ